MPLQSGSSNATISKNIATEIRAGKPKEQAAAIAYRTAGRSRSDAVAALECKMDEMMDRLNAMDKRIDDCAMEMARRGKHDDDCGPDRKDDMSPRDWQGIEQFIKEEKREPEHAK